MDSPLITALMAFASRSFAARDDILKRVGFEDKKELTFIWVRPWEDCFYKGFAG
jgi:hypothetical protein